MIGPIRLKPIESRAGPDPTTVSTSKFSQDPNSTVSAKHWFLCANPDLGKRSFLCLQELKLDPLISHEVGFHDINRAFDLLLEGKSLRCIIWMDK
ncbi:unnamed protein product [Thlaspi arvense]|uniref:Alcohol dehydrogenase n=1 Tax=Thlaspi arvense TaxID=13288 RepID=A0AAU9S2P2_THLAR|nr:unnamed protein product [Thlaspi arvense]